MWTAHGTADEPARFESLRIVEVLFEQDGPKLFTAHTPASEYLVYESAANYTEKVTRYLAVYKDDEVVSQLLTGEIAVLDALSQDKVWAFDQRFDGHVVAVVTLGDGMASVPDNYKPEPGVRLRAEYHYSGE